MADSTSQTIPGLVSTIIPVFNRPKMLVESVDSVLAQSYRPIEIIIVNDGSTDDAGAVADQLAVTHPDIIRVVHRANQGPGPSREAGRSIAQGEFIQYLDSDDLLRPDKFEVQVAALRANPEADIAGGVTRLIDEDGAVLQEPYKWTARPIEQLYPGLLVDRWWCTHTPLYRRELTDRIGPWTDLRYSQDWEYDARAGGLGARIAIVSDLVSEHRQHAGLRQTGSGKWLTPAAQVRFFSSLYEQAGIAGVPANAPEMAHFARWVFTQARDAIRTGDMGAAEDLVALSKQAHARVTSDFRLFLVLRSLLGLSAAARICEVAHRMLPRKTSAKTMPFSWKT